VAARHRVIWPPTWVNLAPHLGLNGPDRVPEDVKRGPPAVILLPPAVILLLPAVILLLPAVILLPKSWYCPPAVILLANAALLRIATQGS
jgi:hypothetical protein